jgi:ataxia telangiectasia mutated family protein
MPLSQRSGVIEFCTGTIPFGTYLGATGKGAHQLYRPNDIKILQCRERIKVRRPLLVKQLCK